MTERIALRDRWHDCRHRLRVLSASVSIYRALGRRGRNGIWVYWRSLDPDEQAAYVRELRRAMNDCWHRAKRPDPAPDEQRSTDALSDEKIAMITRATRTTAARCLARPRPAPRVAAALEDMCYENPDEMRVKFALANDIAFVIEDRGINQVDAAKVAGLSQSDISRIVNGIVQEYSVADLQRALAALEPEIRRES